MAVWKTSLPVLCTRWPCPFPPARGESTATTFANQVFVVLCTPPMAGTGALRRQEGPLLKGSRHALFASEGMSENGKPLRLI